MNYGTDEQKAKYLPDLCSGRKLGCFRSYRTWTQVLMLPVSRQKRLMTEITGFSTVPRCFITNGGYADAFVVMAMTDKSKGTRGGICAFIVEKGDEGFSIGKTEDKMGICASSTTELIFQNCSNSERQTS